MGKADYYRRAHGLLFSPDDVYVTDVDGTTWVTDRYALIDGAAAGILAAWEGRDPSGRWTLRASKPPEHTGQTVPNPPGITSVLKACAAIERWTALEVTPWAIVFRNVYQRVLIREADRRPATVNSDWLDRWQATFGDGLVFEQPDAARATGIVRVSAQTEYRTASYERKTSTRFVAYLQPSRIENFPALPDLARAGEAS